MKKSLNFEETTRIFHNKSLNFKETTGIFHNMYGFLLVHCISLTRVKICIT